jgi:hypothetical protein
LGGSKVGVVNRRYNGIAKKWALSKREDGWIVGVAKIFWRKGEFKCGYRQKVGVVKGHWPIQIVFQIHSNRISQPIFQLKNASPMENVSKFLNI